MRVDNLMKAAAGNDDAVCMQILYDWLPPHQRAGIAECAMVAAVPHGAVEAMKLAKSWGAAATKLEPDARLRYQADYGAALAALLIEWGVMTAAELFECSFKSGDRVMAQAMYGRLKTPGDAAAALKWAERCWAGEVRRLGFRYRRRASTSQPAKRVANIVAMLNTISAELLADEETARSGSGYRPPRLDEMWKCVGQGQLVERWVADCR